MGKDKRYNTVKILIETGHITIFSQIFDYIPLSVVNNEFGSNFTRFKSLVETPSRFKLKDIFLLAHLFEVPEMKMIDLMINQLSKEKRKR